MMISLGGTCGALIYGLLAGRWTARGYVNFIPPFYLLLQSLPLSYPRPFYGLR